MSEGFRDINEWQLCSLAVFPPTVCRFLRARKWDLDASLTMFEASEKWRKDFKVDDLYDNFEYPEKEEVDKWYPQYYHKTDNVSSVRVHSRALIFLV